MGKQLSLSKVVLTALEADVALLGVHGEEGEIEVASALQNHSSGEQHSAAGEQPRESAHRHLV